MRTNVTGITFISFISFISRIAFISFIAFKIFKSKIKCTLKFSTTNSSSNRRSSYSIIYCCSNRFNRSRFTIYTIFTRRSLRTGITSFTNNFRNIPMILNTISNTTNCNPNKISSSLNPIIWIIIGITRIIFKITISSFNILIMSKLSRHAPFGILIATIFCKKTFRIPKSIITIIRFSFPFILYGGGTRITSTRWSIRIINITSISSTKTTRRSTYFIVKPIFIVITPRRR